MSETLHAADATPVPEARELRRALLESRQRWRQFGALATDLIFETDGAGLLTFVAPDVVLGCPASTLHGQPAASLLADPAGPDPFRATVPLHRRRIWLRTAAGTPVCMALTLVPTLDAAGRPRGVRGIGVDVTQQERGEAAAAAALRRAEVLDHILGQMRQEVLAPRMMRAMLDAIMRALGADGAAVVDLLQRGEQSVLHAVGEPIPPPLMDALLPPLLDGEDGRQEADAADGSIALACPCSTRFGDRAAMLVWRAGPARTWDGDDRTLTTSVTGVVRIVLEHEAIQRELARQARTDPLTGLLNRRAFMEEANRRLDRMEREGAPATLLFLDLDRLKQLNDTCGHEAGDSALLLTAGLLHRTFRPADLVARLGGDEFAVWLDGADSLTAAERAEELRIAMPQELAHLTAGIEPMGLSIGIATREPGGDETLEMMIQRADEAMYEVKRSGRGHWRVSHVGEIR